MMENLEQIIIAWMGDDYKHLPELSCDRVMMFERGDKVTSVFLEGVEGERAMPLLYVRVQSAKDAVN